MEIRLAASFSTGGCTAYDEQRSYNSPTNTLSEVRVQRSDIYAESPNSTNPKPLHESSLKPQKENRSLEEDYILGSDGAKSTIRRVLVGDEIFRRTWYRQIVATNVYNDITKYGEGQGAFIVDPEYLYLVALLQDDGLHRISYSETIIPPAHL